MNMFKAFENRVNEAFGAQPGTVAPFSFRRLARRAAREMEAETYVVDGVDTAPALFTILVSADDDAEMRPLYGDLVEEISSFIEAEAARKGYVFVGKPLARFMVDSSLRNGRFAVFANNIDARTLDRLREEEEAFLAGFGNFGGAAYNEAQIVTPLEPLSYESPIYPEDMADAEADFFPDDSDLYPQAEIFPEDDDLLIVEHAVSDDSSAGLTVLPADFVDEHLAVAPPASFEPAAPTPKLEFEPVGTTHQPEPSALSLAESLPDPAIEASEPPAVSPVSAPAVASVVTPVVAPSVAPAASPVAAPAVAPVAEPAMPEPVSIPDPASVPEPAPIPEPLVSAPEPVVERRSLADALPEVVDVQANPIVTEMPEVVGRSVQEVPEVAAAPAQLAMPAAHHAHVPNTQDSTISVAPVPVVDSDPVTCLLIDRQSGRTYVGTAPKTYIGRERTPGGITLHDPNVSRRHSELTYDGIAWRIHDLGSTNGTLVNDIDVDTSVLRDGDIITLGLLNLEFRES